MLTYRTFSTTPTQQYVDAVVNLISSVEGHLSKVTDLKDTMATIGYGYTFNRNDNVAIWQAAGINLTANEWSQLQHIDSTIATQKTAVAMGFTRTLTHNEAKALLGQTYQQYESPANTLAMPESWEKVAFVSVTYNRGVPTVQTKMQDFYNAVTNGDRAEAWFELRYDSNRLGSKVVDGETLTAGDLQNVKANVDDGIAKRRYYEAEKFGLYDNSANVQEAEAKQVLQMYARHQDKITAYEAQYGVSLNGETGVTDNIAKANNDYSLSGADEVDTLLESLTPAHNKLVDSYVTKQNIPININGEVLVGDYDSALLDDHLLGRDQTIPKVPLATAPSNDLLIGGKGNDELKGLGGDDVLYGEEGNDTLDGGSGNDVLKGGLGKDILKGGADFDTYYADNGDTINDSDGKGRVFLADMLLTGGMKKAGDDFWRDKNGHIYTLSGTKLSVASTDEAMTVFSNVITIENFNKEANDLGIHLIDTTTASSNTPRSFIGDFAALLTDTFDLIYDELGNWIRNFDIISPAHADTFTGGGSSDLMQGFGGSDQLQGQGGDDVLEGGADSDILSGGAGDDVLYADSKADLATVYESDTVPSGSTRDWLAGGDGDDQLFGSAGSDGLFGGAENDLMIGGAGNDYIFGDEDYVAQRFDWTATFNQNGTIIFSPVDNFTNSASGDDTIFAGGGNDYVDAGGDDDIVLGDAGKDTLNGGDGNDYLDGGVGDDKLWGDNGNDYLDGGDGNDSLRGGGQDDTLLGGGGSDQLQGGIGDDSLDGGTENDLLSGDDGNDTLLGGASDDELQGNAGNDSLDGGAGNDNLFGQEGDDTLDGGAGDDILQGGAGNDHYRFGRGSGFDIVYDTDGQYDEILLENGLSLKDIRLERYENSVIININNTSDYLQLYDYFLSSQQIEALHFSDGTLFDATAINQTVNYNAAPVAVNDSFIIDENQLSSVLGNVLINDYDLNGDTLALVGQVFFSGSYGNLTFNRDGLFVYNHPNYNYLATGETVTNTFDYVVTDYSSYSSATLSITIEGRNDAPIVSQPIAAQSKQSGQNFVFAIPNETFTDVDQNDVLTLSTQLSNGETLPSWLSFDPLNNTLTGTPQTSEAGLWQIQVTATDSYGASTNSVFALTIAGNSNPPPSTQGQTILGTSANDILNGSADKDTLNGGEGADTLIGGTGNDTYYVDNVNDVVIETATSQTEIDKIFSSVSYTLGANIERLTLLGNQNINATGNELDNTLTGNSGVNQLSGGLGKDTYVVGKGDVIVENFNEGNDTAIILYNDMTSADFENVENLRINPTKTTPLDIKINQLQTISLPDNADSVNLLIDKTRLDKVIVTTGAGSDVIKIHQTPLTRAAIEFTDMYQEDKIDLSSFNITGTLATAASQPFAGGTYLKHNEVTQEWQLIEISNDFSSMSFPLTLTGNILIDNFIF